MMGRWAWFAVILGACSDNGVVAPVDTHLPDTDGADTDAPDTDAPPDTDVAPDTDVPVDTDPPAPQPIRFVALGDGGEGNDAQYRVGAAMVNVCGDRGCDFALYLGDNFYPTGISGVDDEQLQTKFELPYANLEVPFWVAVGNHDYGGEGLGIEFWKVDPQIAYTAYSDKWTLPDRFYSFFVDDVQFVAFDTNAILYGMFGDGFGAEDQVAWAHERWAEPARLRIGFGHHPYISNGSHGNAGNYEGIYDWVPLADIPRGDYVKEFFDEAVCGQVDLYFSGHDHDRQWLMPTCGTEFVVSGAASKNTGDEDRGNPAWFEDYEEPGFVWVEIVDREVKMAFYNLDGTLEYEGTTAY